MTAVRPHVAAAVGLLRRDATVFLSYRWRLLTQYLGVLFSLAIFFYISDLVRVPAFASNLTALVAVPVSEIGRAHV